MNVWPMIEHSAIRQWAGMDEAERDFIETVITRRDHYGFGGCITGGGSVSPQIVLPIWSAVNAVGGQIDLIAVKEDLP